MHSAFSIGLVGLGSLAMVACGGGGSGDPFNGGGGTGGATLSCADLINPPADCGKSCNQDSECVESFCDNNQCVAQCTATMGCGAGSTCNTARGRCVPDIGTGGVGGTGNTGGNACQSVEITPTRTIPNVMFLVDQSGSMTANFGGGQDRWQAAHSAITQIVSELDAIVAFGLTTYQSNNGGSVPDQCPIFESQVAVAMNNASPINMSYPANFPGGEDTPTGESITELVKYLDGSVLPGDGSTFIVLATDGEPDTCAVPDPQTGQAESVAAAAAAFTSGYQTFILSVGTDVSTGHLQDMANVGVGLPEDGSGGNAPFWVGTNPADLENQFRDIISASISCDIQMDKRFDDKEKACNDPESDVRLNGTPLSCPNDWRVKPGADDVIELLGAACDTFKSGSSTFTAVFPCGAIVVE